ncbi:hypothetical protein Tco_0662059, partial [Tanacetum coccineum]
SSDLVFYESPRFVTHIDDPAIVALTKYYKEAFPRCNTPGVALLDICSSWINHFTPGYKEERIVAYYTFRWIVKVILHTQLMPEQESFSYTHDSLKDIDPVAAKMTHPNDNRKVSTVCAFGF